MVTFVFIVNDIIEHHIVNWHLIYWNCLTRMILTPAKSTLGIP